MPYTKSFQDQLSDSLSPIKRKLSNIRTHFLGTKAEILRITQTSKNSFGDKTFSYKTDIIDNVIINYPFSSVEMFSNATESSTAIDLLQYLPITMQIPFADGNTDLNPISGATVSVAENDIIVQVLYDHNKNKIPIVMRVSRGYFGTSGRNVVKRKYELNLMRGNEERERS